MTIVIAPTRVLTSLKVVKRVRVSSVYILQFTGKKDYFILADDDNYCKNNNDTSSASMTDTWQDAVLLQKFPFTKNKGLLVPIPRDRNPIDFFDLLVDVDFLNLIVQETNQYAEECFLSGVANNSRITLWKNVTVTELRIFLGLLLHMGTIKLNRINDYWKKDPLFGLKC